jgi:hypothetical protein
MPIKNTNIFTKYPNQVFVETGSYIGDGISRAIQAGFKFIVSIELSAKYCNICRDRFREFKNVSIVNGDSFEILPEIIRNIDTPITFWLDGHHSCGDTALGKYWAPLIQELEAIKQHHIKTHTIIIDDMRCWETLNSNHGFCKADIINKLLEINKDYVFSYEDGEVANDILVAKV